MITNFTDHSANERTFLAWVRTAIAIVGFGAATARLGPNPGSSWSEFALFLSGAAVVLVAWLRMRHNRARIASDVTQENDSLTANTFLLVLVASLFVLLGVFAIHVG
jgi:putative membrane protein